MKYLVKTPWWLKRLFPKRIWSIDTKEKTVYLTFDDGPHPTVTPFVLDLLKQYEAKATFFCIGKNVEAHPAIYQRLLSEGHSVGNHTHNHLNGWNTDTDIYINNVAQAASVIRSSLFRPPYGRMRAAQAKALKDYKLVMWDVLSGDFDTDINGEQCQANVLKNVSKGSIIVFHDSEKAFPRLQLALPGVLAALHQQGYQFRSLE
ncbi:MAG: polysaccharide deacetylase family protein [Chitinophagaceae bacterium]|nr:polysaccharide deacetylase family protein [Chitinophagaceae bacterium]